MSEVGNQAPVDSPVFARFWTFMSSHEAESPRALRREILAGLSGRVLDVGAGGTNFVQSADGGCTAGSGAPSPRSPDRSTLSCADTRQHLGSEVSMAKSQ